MENTTRVSVLLAGAQLAALLMLAWLASIENVAFRQVFLLAAIGSIVNAVLPDRHRWSLFAALSIASVLVVLGRDGSVVISIGAILLGICHLRMPFVARVALIALVASAVAFARMNGEALGMPAITWVVLASMFMFRLGLYMVAVRRRDVPTGVAESVAYAFMLPNACFPLFPIVDYGTFVRSRVGGVTLATYERGLSWILRGMIQLLAYRLVFYDIAPREVLVYGLGDLVRHVLSAVLLYLKVSGTFHVITGLLHLFGFRLPPTHRLYLLATGFAEYWRRINTYWRDFLMRAVFYPAFLRLRRFPTTVRAVAATLAVFAVSWALHSYQYFWINGRPLLSRVDVSFWTVFALLVAGATIRARRHVPRPDPDAWSARRAGSTLVTFTTITVLWSWWSASSPGMWVFLWTQARYAVPVDWMLLVGVVGIVLTLGASPWASGPPPGDLPVVPLVAVTGRRLALVVALCVLMLPGVQALLPGRVQQYAEHLRGFRVVDQQQFARMGGYYEALMRVVPGRGAPVEGPTFEGDTPDLAASRDDFLMNQLRPSVDGRLLGRPFHTNAAGLRDREYPLEKPANAFRIALLGPSDAMGAGVADGETFEALAEGRLDSVAFAAGRSVEIINFSFTAWTLAQRVLAMRELAAKWSPDLMLLVVNPYELFLLQIAIAEASRRSIPLADAELASVVAGAGLSADMDAGRMITSLRRVEERIHRRTLVWAQEEARRIGAPVAIVTLSFPGVSWIGGLSLLRRAAESAGVPVIECAGTWRWSNGNALALSSVDAHPNPAGHQMIAECLFDHLVRSPLLRSAFGVALPRPAVSGSGAP